MSDIIESLKKVPLFKNLPSELMVQLSGKVKKKSLPKGTVLFQEGERGDALYIIKQGQIQVFVKNMHGQDVVLNQFGPGDSFGEMSLVDQQPRSASAVANSKVELFKLCKQDFLLLMNQNPAFALAIMRDISSKLRFAAIYIEKATEWNQHIAKGEYQKAISEMQSPSIADGSQSDDTRARAFLSSFFQVVEGVKEREDKLKREVQQLNIKINKVKKTRQVAEITETEYFQELQKRAREFKEHKRALQEFAPKVALLPPKIFLFVIPRETRNLRPTNKRFLVSLEMTNKQVRSKFLKSPQKSAIDVGGLVGWWVGGLVDQKANLLALGAH
ncbi:MAG: cyclic nucleotide-binding domain-containing protein [Ardenticatenaceae bacterium]